MGNNVKDFAHQAVDVVADAMSKGKGYATASFEAMKAKAAESADAAKRAAQGLGEAVEAAKPAAQAAPERFKGHITPRTTPVPPRADVMYGTPSGIATDPGAAAAEARYRQGIRPSANPNVNLRAGQLSPEAYQYMKSSGLGGASAPVPAAQPAAAAVEAGQGIRKAGVLSRAAGTLGRLGGPLAAVAGVPDQLANGATNMDDQIALELGSPSEGPLGSAYRGVAGNAISLARRTGNALTFGLGGGDKLVGGIRDLVQGNPLGTTKFDSPTASPAGDPIAARASMQGAPVVPAPAAAPVAPVDAPVDAAGIMSGAVKVPERGTGAFRRTTPGNEGPVEVIDSRKSLREDAVRAAGDGLGGGSVYRRGMMGQAAFIPKMAEVKAAQAKESGKAAEAELGVKQANANTAASNARLASRKDNRETVRRQIESDVRGDEDTTRELASLDPKGAVKPDDVVKNRVAAVERRADYSLGRRGASLDDVTPKVMNDFKDSEKWRKGVESGRLTLGQKLKDFTGNKQFDSQDSFSYRPAFRDGQRVYTENGNSVEIKQATGGTMNLFSPNAPVDADMRRYLENLPTREEWEKAQKGAK